MLDKVTDAQWREFDANGVVSLVRADARALARLLAAGLLALRWPEKFSAKMANPRGPAG